MIFGKNDHEKDCQLNYVGVAPSMEAAESSYGVRYTGFGGGDSKAFNKSRMFMQIKFFL